MHIANQPTPWHVPHDVFNRAKRQSGIGLVMHHQKNACHYLDDQHQKRQRTKNVPKIEILRCVVLTQMFVVKFA